MDNFIIIKFEIFTAGYDIKNILTYAPDNVPFYFIKKSIYFIKQPVL